MKKISGWLFFATIFMMLVVNACQKTGTIYHIDQTKCNQCLKCIPKCGYHAIKMVTTETKDTLIIDPNKCVGCGECVIECPLDAITSASARKNKNDD